MYISMLVSFALSLFLSYILIPRFINMLLKAKIVCENYKLEIIPTSVGIVFVCTSYYLRTYGNSIGF